MIDIVAVAGIVFAIGTISYTGILLGASKGIPFWRTGVVPVVFVVSALVTGHFAIMLGVALFGAASETMASFSVSVISPCSTKVSAVLAVHETYLPWLRQASVEPRGPSHGQSCASEHPVDGSTTAPIRV